LLFGVRIEQEIALETRLALLVRSGLALELLDGLIMN
jgi:hypothetical protein